MMLSPDKVYIICPSSIKTGGTELLHQLAYHLKRNHYKTFIIYSLGTPILDFANYISSEMIVKQAQIEDDRNNLLIVTETNIDHILNFTNIKKCIWWLSVDFYALNSSYSFRANVYGRASAIYHLLTGRIIDKKKIIETANMNRKREIIRRVSI